MIAIPATLLLGGLLVAWPFAEAGYVDDFSYVHMAKVLAETGRFAYNGWPTAMLGVQVWWAAAWIKLLGFSFTIARLSVLPAAIGVVTIVYLLARRCRLPPADAVFAAVSLAFTPTFFMLAPTFMTDVPALFFLLASLLAFVLSVESADRLSSWPTRTMLWLVAGTVLGVLGGTIRQTVWFAVPAGTACVFLSRRTAWRARLAAGACGLVGVAAMGFGSTWFNAQPYAIPTRLQRAAIGSPTAHLSADTPSAAAADVTMPSPSPISPAAAAPAAVTHHRMVLRCLVMLGLVVDCGLFAMPVACFCLPSWLVRQAGSPRRAAGIAVVAVAAAAAAVAGAQLAVGTPRIFVSKTLLTWGTLGAWPARYPFPLERCLTVLQLATVLLLAGSAAVDVCRRGRLLALLTRPPAAVLVPMAFLAPYLAVLVLAARTTGGVFERYFLPFLPIVSCVVLAWTAGLPAAAPAEAPCPPVHRSRWGWVAVALLAALAIAGSHDAFAANRALVAAIDHLQRQGVPRDRIAAGISLDGWEQIERAGFINDRRIRVPSDAWKPLQPDGYPLLPLRGQTPRIVPEYIVTADADFFPGEGPPFPAFPFTCWLPPHDRAVFIHHQPPSAIPVP